MEESVPDESMKLVPRPSFSAASQLLGGDVMLQGVLPRRPGHRAQATSVEDLWVSVRGVQGKRGGVRVRVRVRIRVRVRVRVRVWVRVLTRERCSES